MSAHEMQHADSPTWCIHCGTFDIYCAITDCIPKQERRFDMRDPEVWQRTLDSIFPSIRRLHRVSWERETPDAQGVREGP